MDATPELSFVIPVFDEQDSIAQLFQELCDACEQAGRTFEIVFVNDGSRDDSGRRLDALAAADPRVRVVHFRRNFGKSPALAAGFERANGAIVFTLDADLQDDPKMIPAFLAELDKGADLVSGWKERRHDPLGKTLPSKVFNGVVRQLSGLELHDFNCGFKAYRREIVDEVTVYGGLHRFMPVLAAARGFKVVEVVVEHRARQHGVSKFGARRFFDGVLDLMTVMLVTRFRTRPLHFFGVPGFTMGAVGFSILCYLAYLWTTGEAIGTRPLLTLGVLLSLGSIQMVLLGLLGE
ncbi:MAG: glycosyltransferase family 2 protein, partial [Nannocystaceae bacterium]